MGLSKKERLDLLKSLRVDLFLTFYNLSVIICGLSLNQLVEDKICFNQLKLDSTTCLNIENVNGTREADKDYIISTAATFKNYQTLISTLPTVVLIFFIGHWIDNHPKQLKYILAVPAIGGTIISFILIFICFKFQIDYRFLLLTDVVRGLTGGSVVVFTGIYTYITQRTPSRLRTLRFAILELFKFIPNPISTYLGGLILNSKPWIADQPRNYIGVFFLSASFSIVGTIWILLSLNDSDQARKLLDLNGRNDDRSKSNNEVEEKPAETASKIFDLENVKNMIQTCIKKRENGFRARIWHSILALTFTLLCMSETVIEFPFAQKVYHWDSAYYSRISPIFMILTAAASSFAIPVLIRRFSITDTKMCLLGFVSLFLSLAVRGLWLSPNGYYVSSFAGILSGLLQISIRAFLARMIKSDEIAQIYSLLSAIEAFAPLLSSLFYTTIFHATISFNPGLVYLIACAFLIYPFCIIVWLDFTKSVWYNANEEVNIPQTTVYNTIES
ncbi:uncharacterized protein LOC107362612 [Tetranychus urticae]|uniref:Major facilitator superfamily (MFS) profile domain-containing protein n=1 Tax=Tetranychus urticae TaxID=32264 RepID=T1KAI1_TETUR|nr:uncharacterized protein LOC107362612 [Tetranychus urticae]